MQPSLFISHGAPSIAIDPSPARTFLQELPGMLPERPAAILIVSAHWQARRPTLTGRGAHATIHDFGGFPEALYKLHYRAPGAPAVLARVEALLRAQGMAPDLDENRGLDHGAWAPLMLGWPDADMPIVQLSLVAGAGAAGHLALGRALAPLRDENVLIIGSGSFTHNLREWFTATRSAGDGTGEPGWVTAFAEWMHERLSEADLAALSAYRSVAPFAERNHPSDEHLTPLFVALGAAGAQPTATRLHRSADHNVMRLDAYRFDG